MADPSAARGGWAWFAPPAAPSTPGAASGTDAAPAFARCFAGPDGARVLASLKAMTLERALGPDAPDAALRHLEGQRQLVATILALRRMAETTPAGFRSHAPAIRRKADEWTTSARLLPGITLAQWFAENEPLLQEGFSRQERVRVVAVALLPLFKQNPDSWEATEWLDVETRGTFREYLADWHARVPERLRPVVRRIAEEFGIEIQTARGDTG
mgnify:CR=1 FL=1